jgi:hypothetical protein
MATRVLLELGVFKYIAENESTTSQELADVTKAEKILLGMSKTQLTLKASLMFSERLLRVVTASGYVVELDESTYASNPLTKALATRQTAGLVEFM